MAELLLVWIRQVAT